MLFLKFNPPSDLAHIVREFWIVENPDDSPRVQNIIPDGYCEMIFHYGHSYRIKLSETWEAQEQVLFSGQLRKHFSLQNTGVSAMLGIKLMPEAPYLLFGKAMDGYTDRVVPLSEICISSPPEALTTPGIPIEERIHKATTWIEALVRNITRTTQIAPAIRDMLNAHGMLGIESLARDHAMTRRHLEREFKKVIGLTPKYFSRIIQFSYIFEAMQREDSSWVDVALNSGYFDQSHFIRNFKAFTGESPARYGFDEINLANFFLRK